MEKFDIRGSENLKSSTENERLRFCFVECRISNSPKEMLDICVSKTVSGFISFQFGRGGMIFQRNSREMPGMANTLFSRWNSPNSSTQLNCIVIMIEDY